MSLFLVCYIFKIINIYKISKIKYCSCSNAFVSCHGQNFQPEKKKILHSQDEPSVHFPTALENLFHCTCFHVALFQGRETKSLQAELVLTKAPFTISNFTTKLNFFSRSCQSLSPSANRHNMTLPTLGESSS